MVYTINEPAAAGAYNALKKAGKDKGVIIVSVDGGCAGRPGRRQGVIAATSQQYPLKMAAMGVAAGVRIRQDRQEGLSGYVDTGVTLIADKAVAGVDSKDVKTGTDLCWGTRTDRGCARPASARRPEAVDSRLDERSSADAQGNCRATLGSCGRSARPSGC